MPQGPSRLLAVGDSELLLPEEGDIHRVDNAIEDGPSISIHVYGADIGRVRRRVFESDGRTKAFVSGYSETPAMLERLTPAGPGRG